MEREVGGGIGMGNTCKPMAVSFQCMTKSTTIKKKKKKCKKTPNMYNIHTVEYYSAIKRKMMPFVATWMDLEIIILSEEKQMEKDKYHITYK